MSDKSPERSTTLTVLMTPDLANFSGHVHGGAILRLLDQVAYVCAARYSGRYVVTASVDQVSFRAPVHVGELVTCKASVNYTGRSSMEVGVRVEAESIRTRTVRHVMTCYFTMIAVNEEGRPTPTTPLVPETPDERRRWAAAQLRSNLRKEMERRSLEIKQNPEELLISCPLPEARVQPSPAGPGQQAR